MALNRQIQAACLLLLLLASLTSTSFLSHQVRAHRAWAQQASRTREPSPARRLLKAAETPGSGQSSGQGGRG